MLEVLEVVKNLSELIPEPFEGKQQYQSRLKASLYGRYSPERISRGVYYLKKKGFVEVNKIPYQLTNKGKFRMSEVNLRRNMKRSDGSSTIIIFDIPQTQSQARRVFRRILQNLGFTHLQKSVLVGPYELPLEFYEFLDELKIRKHVKVIEGKIIY